jgi:ribosomal protein S18 acetylase RimI-like enzyme
LEDVLFNPVYNALVTGDASLAQGTGEVRYFDKEVSPFAGFPNDNHEGFQQLHRQLPTGRKILYAHPELIFEPLGWQLLREIKGLQFIYEKAAPEFDSALTPIALTHEHVEAMVQLTALTQPGPFDTRTIEFGHYYGIFDQGMLVAMTGQRLHINYYTEISAVCTHPQHLGKGYAAALMQHQLNLIIRQGQIPILHVRDDNQRAIALYERLGFTLRRTMNFYFMLKKELDRS